MAESPGISHSFSPSRKNQDPERQPADPLADGDEEGRGVLRARAVAFGPLGARHAVEADLARVCEEVAGEEWCRPGIRVQSWQEVRQLVP